MVTGVCHTDLHAAVAVDLTSDRCAEEALADDERREVHRPPEAEHSCLR